ncbi:MAG TPA: alkaline phosphatase D family protein [Phycisphaerae bacterium]|nr:alkaline phosphatase D family protein [Phycisphaerae bacterium]
MKRRLALHALVILAATTARADVAFTGIAAGDATTTSAIVWARAVDAAAPGACVLALQYGTDEKLAGATELAVQTSAERDFTCKAELTSLQPNTRYYYRFLNPTKTQASAIGTFKTAPAPDAAVEIRLAFSGDAHTQWRPYPSIKEIAGQKLDFFVFLGDTMYETSAKASPSLPDSVTLATTDTSTAGATPEKLLAEYHTKYREQFAPVNKEGQAGLTPFFLAQGNYTLLDNHELGNKQYIDGGAPQGPPIGGVAGTAAAVNAVDPGYDVNATGKYMHQTAAYRNILQAYLDYQPIRESTVTAPDDPRMNGTPKLYAGQRWGRNLLYVTLDDRSYRDIRMRNAAGDETGSRANNPARTMLGKTQVEWIEKTLADAQAAGIAWKIISVSSPIDQMGAKGTDGRAANADGGKTWYGGYRAERNSLLKFIADHKITNVVFLSTDDHQNRVNELCYFADEKTLAQNTAVRVPGCFTIVAGPIGASGPDGITNHAFASLKTRADTLARTQTAAGVDPIGLAADYPGLHDVFREGDPDADKLRQPIDFYSPDTFNYALLRISADGKTLSIDTWGVNSYAANTYPELSAANPVRRILGFQVSAQ